MAVAISLFPLISETWHAFALNALLGTGSGAFWPSQSGMITALTSGERRHSAYAIGRMTMNLGVALGGVVGGLIASTANPGSFTVLFLLDARPSSATPPSCSRASAAAPARRAGARHATRRCCATASTWPTSP